MNLSSRAASFPEIHSCMSAEAMLSKKHVTWYHGALRPAEHDRQDVVVTVVFD